MTAQVRLNRYEQEIVKALEEHYGHAHKAARQIVVQYIGVVRLLGGYDNPVHHAERLHLAFEAGHPADKWMERIRFVEHEARLAGGISQLEGPYAQVR